VGERVKGEEIGDRGGLNGNYDEDFTPFLFLA
jgi:hypothetical protein